MIDPTPIQAATTPNPPITDPIPPIAHLERKAALLLLAAATLIASFALYVMVARGVFDSTQQLVLVSDDSEGVMVGMEVTFSGFPIGRVRRIELGADGKARMVVDVPHKDAHWLRTSSIFTMERGMVGDTHIRAFSGVLTDPPLPANAERTLLRGDTGAEIPRLVASARELLENLTNMTSPQSSLNASLANLKAVTDRTTGRYGVLAGVLGSDLHAQKIITTLDKTNQLLATTDRRIYGDKGVVDGMVATMSSTRGAIEQLTAVLGDTRASLQKVDAVLAEAQAVGANVRMASTDLGALRAEVEANLRRIGQLTDEINRKWPFARDTQITLP